MRTTKILLLMICMAGLAACGGKNKKKDTTVTDTGAGTGTGDTTNANDDSGTMAPSAGTDPSLQEIVYFDFDKYELDEAARAKLEENAEWLKKDPQRTLTIEGHTDEVGTSEYNLGLGEKRAQASRDYLLRLGIEENRISIITYGEERPASAEDDENRRSVFVATRKK